MSRIGKMPIVLPAGVSATINGHAVEIKGPKGTLSREFSDKIDIELEDGVLKVIRHSDEPEERSLHGLTRALLNRAAMSGNKLSLTVGKSHPVEMDPGSDLKVEVPQPNIIVISGIDKEKVGAFAANVREVRPPEPYKGKGIRYSDEYVRRKAGQAGAKA